MTRLLVVATLSVVLLTSCSTAPPPDGDVAKLRDDSEERAAARIEEIVKAINERDRETIKSMFSEQALGEAADIDKGID